MIAEILGSPAGGPSIHGVVADRLPEVGGPNALAPGPQVNAALSRLVAMLTADNFGYGAAEDTGDVDPNADRSEHWAIVRSVIRRVTEDPVLLDRAHSVRRAAGIAETLMEAHHARELTSERNPCLVRGGCRVALLDQIFGSFPYLGNYRQLVDAELTAAATLGPVGRVAFCGSGPLPLTAVLWHLASGAEVVLLEIQPEAAELARGVLDLLGQHGVIDRDALRVDVGDGVKLDPSPFDLVIVASLVPNKVSMELGRTVVSLGDDGPLLMTRSAVGLTGLLAYQPIDIDAILDTGLQHLGTVAPAGQIARQPVMEGLAVDATDGLLLAAPTGVLNTSEFFARRRDR